MKKALDHLKKSDAVLASIIARVGPCTMAYRDPTFEMLARAIVFQQLSTKAATTIYRRLEEAAGGALTPQAIQNLSVGEMRRAGLSRQKLGYIRDLAEHALSGKVDFAKLPAMSDEEVIASLTDIKGVGVWTAHMFLLFSLRRPNVLPIGDLGVRMAIQKAYRKRKMPTPKQVEQIAKGWHPYCSFAAWYLWRSLEFPKEESTTEARRHGEKPAKKSGAKRKTPVKARPASAAAN
jgi:DNA-3-methyladenine glycosylase II